jgi:hypothetical protein
MASKPIRLIGLCLTIVGAIMFAAGAATLVMVRQEIASQQIVVSADTPFLNDLTAGKTVNGPLDALAQAEAILLHSTHGDPDLTYASIGDAINVAKAAGDTAKVEELTAQRQTLMDASFLRASLFTSVLAFGVSFFVLGVGLVVALTGFALFRLSGRPVATPASAPPTPAAV